MNARDANALGLLADLAKGCPAAYAAALDMLEEAGADGRELARLRGLRRPSWGAHEVEQLLAKHGLFSYEDTPAQKKARAFQKAVLAVDVEGVPVMTGERRTPRKEQARLCRELLKRLGIRGASVTTPDYSMARVVQLRLPKLEHCDRDRWPHSHEDCCRKNGVGHHDWNRCPACAENEAVRKKVEDVLAMAFPNHDDRSDYQSDYFDHCWSVD